jgi:hypothetical protein
VSKQNDITRSARGKACTFKSDVCDSGVNNENVVFCHENVSGVGIKAKDVHGHDIGFYGCFNCHKLYDTLEHPYYKPHFIKEMAQFAITRTKRQLVRSLLVDEYYSEAASAPRTPYE